MGYSQQENVKTNQIIAILLSFLYLFQGKVKSKGEVSPLLFTFPFFPASF